MGSCVCRETTRTAPSFVACPAIFFLHVSNRLLGRAARLARLANIPFSGLQRRHVVHWLRIPMDEQCVDSDTDDEEGLSDEDWSDLEGPSDEEWCRTAPLLT